MLPQGTLEHKLPLGVVRTCDTEDGILYFSNSWSLPQGCVERVCVWGQVNLQAWGQEKGRRPNAKHFAQHLMCKSRIRLLTQLIECPRCISYLLSVTNDPKTLQLETTFIPSHNFHGSGSPWLWLCHTGGCSPAAARPGVSTSGKWQEASVSRHVGLFLGLPAECPHDVEAGLFRASDHKREKLGPFINMTLSPMHTRVHPPVSWKCSRSPDHTPQEGVHNPRQWGH